LYCAPYDATDILVISPEFILGLHFKDEYGYLSLPGGGILRRMDVGSIIQGTRSGYKAVKVENRTPLAIQNVTVNVEETPEGDTVQLRSEEHTSELQSRENLVCRLLLEKKKKII